tara:strand:+ start:151 stop:666 length:516 start_codon:yes stop_codon:yes gene_type:complete
MYVSEKHESFAREHIAMVRNRIYHKIVEYADIDLDTDQRIRLFDIRVKLNDAPIKQKIKELSSSTKVKRNGIELILRTEKTVEQSIHQEMGDDTSFWQALIPLHQSNIDTVTTVVKRGSNERALDMEQGQWCVIRGDVWHYGTKTNGVAPEAFTIGDHSVMSLLTVYYTTE